jgi:hypothetical protein
MTRFEILDRIPIAVLPQTSTQLAADSIEM